MKNPITLTTKRLTLRPLTMDDLQTVHTWQSDAESKRYNNSPHTDISETAEYLKENVVAEWESNHQNNYNFGIEFEGKLIGEIAFSYGCGGCGRCKKGEAAIGYIIHKDFRGHGYEAEATSAIIEHCFSVLNAEIIKTSCDIESLDEINVIKSLGFMLKEENETCEYSDGTPFVRNAYFLKNPNLAKKIYKNRRNGNNGTANSNFSTNWH